MSAMPAAKNQPDDIKIRKYRDTLVTGGLAIIAFGVWTVLKSILETSFVLRAELGSIPLEELSQVNLQELKAMIEDNSLFYGIMAIIVIALVVELAIRVYFGLSARAIGLQKKKKNGKERNGIVWLILGIVMAALDVYSLIRGLLSIGDILKQYSVMYFICSLFVDVTSIFVTVELVVTGFKLRGLSKKHTGEEEARNAA